MLTKKTLSKLLEISNEILKLSGGKIYGGPFCGLKIPSGHYLSTRPYWTVGCYEEELHQIFKLYISSPPTKFIEVGSAHGYYAVGIASKIHDICVIAYETESNLHNDLLELAELNNVEKKIIQKGCCTVEDLRNDVAPGSLVLVDCEGGEFELLDMDKIPELEFSHIICETHDFLKPGITPELIHRFKNTHSISYITEQLRNPNNYRILNFLDYETAKFAISETRHVKSIITYGTFLHMTPLRNK